MYIIKAHRISLRLPFLSGKFNFNMKKCNKCSIDKEEKEYYTYYHSVQQKWRTRNICNTCMKLGYREYKNKMKELSQQILIPVIPEETDPRYKKCESCNTWKLKKVEFYLSSNRKGSTKRCKVCQKKKEAENRVLLMAEKGGSDRVPLKPNNYTDKYQKAQTFEFMEALGWIFIEATGKWWKPGVRDIEGNFEKFKTLPDDQVFIIGKSFGNKVYKTQMTVANFNKMKQMKEEGYSNKEIADVIKVDPSTVSKWVGKRKSKDEERSN
jgi:transposase